MDYSYFSDGYSAAVTLFSWVIRLAIWGVVGYVMGKKAKEVGLSFGVYFALTFLLGVIGLVISIVKINNQKKMMGIYQQQNMYNNQYGQNQYQQPYQQNQNPYQNNANPYGAAQNPYQNQQANPYQNQQANPYQNQTANPYQQQSATYQDPQHSAYTNPYNSQPAATGYDNPNGPASTFGMSFTCKECGNVQSTAGFCKVCGAKL